MNSEPPKTTVKANVPLERPRQVVLLAHASLELLFKGGADCTLIQTKFQFAPNDSVSVQRLTNNRELGFQWTSGVKGLSLCLIRYVLDSKMKKPAEFKYTGPVFINSKSKAKKKSPAASLGSALGKKTIWVEWMFKSQVTELAEVIDKLFGGHNREGKNKNIDVTVTIKPSRLPPSQVKIILDGAPLTTVDDLEKLYKNITNQCPPNNREASGPLESVKQFPVSESKTAGLAQRSALQNDDQRWVQETVQKLINFNVAWKVAAIKAANQGDVTAQYNLGVCYEMGEGVTRDNAEAVKWFRKAAEQGDIRAQYQLGVWIAELDRTTKNQVQAYKWFGLASALGHGRAQKQLNKIASKMTKKQTAQAERLVCEFERKHPKGHRPDRGDLRGIFSWQESLLTA